MRLGDIRRRLGLHRDDRGLAAAAVREALGDLLVLGAADGEPRWMHPGENPWKNPWKKWNNWWKNDANFL